MAGNREKTEAFEPQIILFYCHHCTGDVEDLKVVQRSLSGFKVRFFIMPCTGKIEVAHILGILSEGIDGIQVVGCKKDNCQSLVGSSMAEKRINRARSFLNEINMGADRVGMEWGEDLSSLELIKKAKERAEAVKPLGPNIMKEGVKIK